MSVDLNLVNCAVKVECEEYCGAWEVPLYAEHEVKGELVLGPEQVQPQDAAFMPPNKDSGIKESSIPDTSNDIQQAAPEASDNSEPSPEPFKKGLKLIHISRLTRQKKQTTQKTNLKVNNKAKHDADSEKYNLLPKISREKYLKVYDNFVSWQTKQKTNSVSEIMLVAYFKELSKTLQPSTLWVIYSMLKAMLDTKHSINIKNYGKLTTFLKRLSEGYKPQTSRVLTEENIETFLREAPDEKYLAMKVVLIFGINGACRAVEMTEIKTNHLEDHQEMLFVNLPTTKTRIDRAFVIRNELLHIVRKYQMLRPKNTKHDRFFINYFNGRCTKQPMGRHKLAAAPKTIAKFLKLPNAERYTGHCFRRTSASMLAAAGANLITHKRHGSWNFKKGAAAYIDSVEKSDMNKMDETIISPFSIVASTSEIPDGFSSTSFEADSIATELLQTANHPELLLLDEESNISKSSNEDLLVKPEPLTELLESPAFDTGIQSLQDPLSLDDPINTIEESMDIEIENAKGKNEPKKRKKSKEYNMLPEKSRERYFMVYNNFIVWKTDKSISESVLLEYFKELSSLRLPSTLWATYSMLKATIQSEHNINIKCYKKLRTLLKTLSAGYKPQRSKVLTADNVERFIREAPDEKYLAIKVILIFGINGACRANELTEIKTSYLQDHKDMILVNLPKNKVDRAFAIRGEFLNIVRKYQKLRPSNVGHDRLFLKYATGRCTKQPMGRHTLAAVPKTIAAFLKLPNAESYTGHCFRRTSANLQAKANGTLKKLSRKVAESYIKVGSRDKQAEVVEGAGLSESRVTSPVPAVALAEPMTAELASTEINVQEPEAEATSPDTKILPAKSAEKYLRAYEQFMYWREKRRTQSFSENLILAYFMELAKNMKPTSLWAIYSMLKNTLKMKHDVDIKSYTSLLVFLKGQSAGFLSKKSKVLTEDNIRMFLNEAPDDIFLATKVAVIIGVTGACRTFELTNLTTNDMTHHEDTITVQLRDSKTNRHRTFTIAQEFVRFIEKYQALRPETTTDRFFLNYRSGKCTNQCIGRHKMAALPAEIAEYLKLPNSKCYTGHCFRRSATILAYSADER